MGFSSEFEETLNKIEIRKTAMQSIWHRIERLSPYVELKEKVDYNKDLATEDAKEVLTLLEKTKKSLVIVRVTCHQKVLPTLRQQYGLYQIIFINFILRQKSLQMILKMQSLMMI